jgi:hypothetical protein
VLSSSIPPPNTIRQRYLHVCQPTRPSFSANEMQPRRTRRSRQSSPFVHTPIVARVVRGIFPHEFAPVRLVRKGPVQRVVLVVCQRERLLKAQR